ncbi:GNAT family N-acetyltransferase [Sphingobium aquiterrae]|jgi:ribosomal protein S18 acetylase RimI-like enzyme|uniref:GNAT family N-acetyltransferase n=1 Tax=Sphingobium aquiterrae TaxID=2038656 RepID=UPI00301806E7
MSEPTLRRAVKEDVPEIRALVQRAYARWLGVTSRPPKPLAADYDRAFGAHRFDVLVHKGELIALLETVAEGRELLIVNVAVDPDRQREGLGQRLMRHAEDLARAAGFEGTRLYTNALMTANIALYERLGYVREREVDHGDGMVAVHMVRTLGA